ncbi:fibronectin type III domain-containing protein [Occallatibacter savannae]|uniref:fibronectin type III domain-containing protein n=1 Tax=Occallatibacter savannae TaxID=1002691 RepID=UPI000D699319|nr:fibronectin type III domain-containing protein [Occallatibacter savannae]
MYQSQVRPAINARKLVAQQTTRPHSNSFSSVLAALHNLHRSNSYSKLAGLLILVAGVAFVTGCGSLNYKGVGSAASQALSAVSCGTQSLTGPQSRPCSISLNAPALTLITIKLSSDNAALQVPAQVQITVGQSSATFNAVTPGVQKTATATITAQSRGVAKTAAITLYPALATLAGISCSAQTLTGPTSATCSVQLGNPAPSAVAVTLSSSSPDIQVPASITVGSGSTTAQFTAIASAVPAAENVTLTAASGGATQTFAVSLQASGIQSPIQHRVQLSWLAPTNSGQAIVGYNIYRAIANVSGFAALVTADPQTSYTDTAVQSGSTYDYVVKSVDANGVESGPSNPTEVTIP